MAGKQLQRSIILSVGMAFFLSSARVWGSHESPLVPMLRSQNRRRRHLQAIEGALPVCNTSGAVNFDIDEPHYIIFASEFEPVCSCDEVRNDNQVIAAINSLNFSDTNAFVGGFNQALGSLARSSEYSCVNDCESCFHDGVGNTLMCGIWETREAMSFANSPGNFTLEQILAKNVTTEDTVALIAKATYALVNCITYTLNQSGTICSSIELKSIPVEGQDQPCTITYNDVACNSCFISGVEACFVADCTNINADAQIETCATDDDESGLIGPFIFLRYFSGDFGNNTGSTATPAISRGRCNVPPVSAAPMTTPSSGASAPVVAPVQAAPSGTLLPSPIATWVMLSSITLFLYI